MAVWLGAGCAVETPGEEPRLGTTAETLVCEAGDGPDRERYHLPTLNLELERDPKVRELSGVNVVETCEQARLVRAAQDDLTADREDEPRLLAAAGAPEAVDELDLDPKVWRGTTAAAGRAGYVYLFGCSGVFINDRTILTAAHCVPDTPEIRSLAGQGGYTVSYRPWNGSTRTTRFARIWMHAGYSGNGDADDDLAIIQVAEPNDGQGMRIYTGELERHEVLELNGYGVTASCTTSTGTLRRDPDGDGVPVHARMDHQIRSYAEQGVARTCSGDSGTPLVKQVSGRDTIVAIHSNSEKDPDDTCENRCAMYEGKQEHVRLRTKMDWIQQRIGACTSHLDGTYFKCF
ncbi:MAG TPA: trypsin-like serine protease [Polyangiaceae bacterium]